MQNWPTRQSRALTLVSYRKRPTLSERVCQSDRERERETHSESAYSGAAGDSSRSTRSRRGRRRRRRTQRPASVSCVACSGRGQGLGGYWSNDVAPTCVCVCVHVCVRVCARHLRLITTRNEEPKPEQRASESIAIQLLARSPSPSQEKASQLPLSTQHSCNKENQRAGERWKELNWLSYSLCGSVQEELVSEGKT